MQFVVKAARAVRSSEAEVDEDQDVDGKEANRDPVVLKHQRDYEHEL